MNRFGTSSNKYALLDPLEIRSNRLRFRRDAIPSLSRANSIYIPAGRYPVRGWILLDRENYNKLSTYSTSLELEVGNQSKTDNIGTLKNLSIVQAQCVTYGLASDKKAIYLVEITDKRGVISNQWFQYPLTAQYNIRAPAYPDVFYSSSLNSGTTWTWETMLQNIWNSIDDANGDNLLGDWPGFPSGYTVSGTPEGFWFNGVSAWCALNDILDHIGLTIACDLTQANPYTLVNPGADDESFTALQDKYAVTTSPLFCKEDDQEYIDTGAGRVPRTVVVLFPRRNQIYGTEETVRRDGKQWSTTAYYAISVSAPATFSSAVGKHYIWSDFDIKYDQEGNPLGADVATAQTIAAERVTQYFTRIYRQTLGYMNQTYSGALPFITGSQVDGVAYCQDYRDQRRQGWKTKITRGACPPFADVWD